jgi:hypothetical protein
MQDALNDGTPVNYDRLAEYQAIAVLFPWTAREVLLAPYKNDLLSLDDISRMADIPRKYVSFVMSEFWEESYNSLLAMT